MIPQIDMLVKSDVMIPYGMTVIGDEHTSGLDLSADQWYTGFGLVLFSGHRDR
jgi:hypothetical protein